MYVLLEMKEVANESLELIKAYFIVKNIAEIYVYSWAQGCWRKIGERMLFRRSLLMVVYQDTAYYLFFHFQSRFMDYLRKTYTRSFACILLMSRFRGWLQRDFVVFRSVVIVDSATGARPSHNVHSCTESDIDLVHCFTIS